MSPYDKRNRGRRSTTDRPASHQAEYAREDDALALNGDQEAELPYYVELAGDYSIRQATVDNWGSDEAADDAQSDNDEESALRQSPARLPFWLNGI